MKKTLDDLDFETLNQIAAEAFKKAAEYTLARGLPVAGMLNGQLVERYPDGRIEKLDPQCVIEERINHELSEQTGLRIASVA